MSNVLLTPHRESRWWLAPPLAQMLLLALLPRPANSAEWLLAGSFVALTFFAAHRLFADERPYSLAKVWWLFGIIFLSIVPSAQAALHSTPWHSGDISTTTMIRANGLIGICFVVFEVIQYALQRGPATGYNNMPAALIFSSGYARRYRIVAPVLMAVCGIILVVAFGPASLFLRGHLEVAELRYSTTTQLLIDKVLRGIMLYLSLTGIFLYRGKQLSFTWLTALLIAALVLNFPLALPRYLSFTIYMAWLLAAGFAVWRRRHFFTLVVLAMLLLAGPVISITRYAGIDMGERLADPAKMFKTAFLISDFDAYSSLCRVMQYTGQHGATGGRQLAGVALFFVPRALWPAKPIGSGAFLFTELGYEFKNVSCAFLGEGYINFGWAGSLIFTVVMAGIIGLYDRYYWTRASRGMSYPRLFYLVLIGMMFFLLRGDLLSSFAYTAGLCVVGWMVDTGLRWSRIF